MIDNDANSYDVSATIPVINVLQRQHLETPIGIVRL